MLVYLSKNNIRFINKEFKRLKKVHSLLNYLMGTITIVAVYQALLKYPEYGTKLLSITKDPTAYSPTLLLSTLTAGAKSATYFLHKTQYINILYRIKNFIQTEKSKIDDYSSAAIPT